ncbi:MAG: DUF2298 domain-containing protein [Candidatus Promineifilaceae bacterium]|nr:DUF2298 domain-containing protein [Candidatus Promineifilaceae bacterium]
MPLADFFAAVRWWAALMVLGAAALPLAFTLLRWLPDRGYAFVKMMGLLVVTYLFWLLGSLGFLANNVGSLVFCLVLFGAASAWVYRRGDGGLRAWLRENGRYVVTAELVFAAVFFLWAWVRAQNPAITGTEKPMEFAFLNAAGRSRTFPPHDPWLSGFGISYYYFGYVMTSVIGRLAVVPETIGFNLGIAWLAAGAAVGAFGVVYNLVAAGTEREGRRPALILGLVAAVALPLAGNLQILLELLHANGIGSDAFWAWLNVRDINTPAVDTGFGATGPRFWWWWRSSRVIHEHTLAGIPEEGLEPIVEFPGFSFLLGDMHPHVLALPFAFLGLAVALLWWLKPIGAWAPEEWAGATVVGRFRLLVQGIGAPTWALTALVLGGLSFLNTWDVLIHLFVVVGAFVLRQWRRRGRWDNAFLAQGAMAGVLLAVPAVLLYLPFYLGFRSQAGPPYLLPMLMRPTRLAHFLIIFGMSLWSVLILVGVLLAQRQQRSWRVGVGVAAGLLVGLSLLMLLLGWIIAASPAGGERIVTLGQELGVAVTQPPEGASPLGRLGWGLRAVLVVAPSIMVVRLSTPWLTLLLAVLVGAVVMVWVTLFRQDDAAEQPARAATAGGVPPALPFVLLLILTSALLTLGPEFVYLRDNFGQRLNTVFKFYYQAWIMFGVAALFGLDYLRRNARPVAVLVTAGYSLMLAVALLFPINGVSSRAQEYGNPSTLNGIAHYRYQNPEELDALTWLRQNVEGTPVISEAVGGQYSPQGHGRVSATTGLPTILGWAGHEYQWRGDTPEPGMRDPAVATIYGQANWEETTQMLNRYDVEYVYVGPLEVSTYGSQAATKFEDLLEVAYANNGVIIYRWLPR